MVPCVSFRMCIGFVRCFMGVALCEIVCVCIIIIFIFPLFIFIPILIIIIIIIIIIIVFIITLVLFLLFIFYVFRWLSVVVFCIKRGYSFVRQKALIRWFEKEIIILIESLKKPHFKYI